MSQHTAIPYQALLQQEIQRLQPYMISLLQELVACDSTQGKEISAAACMDNALRALGLEVEHIVLDTQEIKDLPLYSPACCPDGGRYNVLASFIPSTITGKSVLFNGHLDVVPTGPNSLWDDDPFSGRVEGDWLYGRGSGDMKAGIVCFLAAYKALKNLGLTPNGVIGFNGVIEEEYTGNGTLATVNAIRKAMNKDKLTGYDAVIIPEPFNETMMSAQIGVFWMYVDIVGKPAHASVMTTGINPVNIGLEIMDELRALERKWNLPENRHPAYKHLEHPINFNLGQIHAGEWNSSVPCVCTLGLRIACYPDMSIEDAKRVVENIITDVSQRYSRESVQVSIRYEGFHAPGCTFDLDSAPMQVLATAHEQVNGKKPERTAVTATTDARHFQKMMNTPVTCYGPISDDIHGFNERVSISSMLRVTEVMALFICEWCGVTPKFTHHKE